MYFYEVGYHSYEDSEHFTLVHEEQYSQETFNTLVEIAAANAYVLREKDYRDSLQYLITPTVDILVETFGFQRLDYQATWSAFGWSDVIDPESWDSAINDANQRLTARIRSMEMLDLEEEDEPTIPEE